MEQDLDIAVEKAPWTAESGQTAVLLVLIMGLFMVGVLGFAVDLTNVWFHRQAASAAADAACQAGAMDMLSSAAGLTPSGAGFAIGTASDCVSSASATMCTYANDNGYAGTGLVSGSPSNAVSWTFPSSVSGVTPGGGANSFLKVSISENVKTYFTRLLTQQKVMNINVNTTCGVASVKSPAPMMVLNPTTSGAFTYSGGGALYIVGGPVRSLQVNSSSATAISWGASAIINTSAGGPNETGSDVAIVGGPSTIPTNGSSVGFNGGTTGVWKPNAVPIPDPYGSVPIPASVKNLTPSTTTSGKSVTYGTDGCPDHSNSCREFGPGYYPSGIALSGVTTGIFLPGIYYMNGSLKASASSTVRVATPAGYKQSDGVMFYFLSGSLQISGCSGCTNSNIDSVPSTTLTCDGSTPSSALGMPSGINGNVLYSQCTTNATYWDPGGDTTDSVGSPGSRGLLIFQDHSDTTQPALTGSGALSFSGALYFHSSSYSDVLSLSGGSSSGTFILGEIVADKVSLTGSGEIKLALSPVPSVDVGKVGMF
jgi:hypothetical protein